MSRWNQNDRHVCQEQQNDSVASEQEDQEDQRGCSEIELLNH